MIYTRRPKTQKVYFPNFGNLLNEFINTPVNDAIRNSSKNTSSPAVNVIKSDENYILEIAAPGHAKKDINITIDKDVLLIASKKEANNIEAEYRLREFNYAGFERRFTLPDTVDQNNVDATFKNGILSITLAKKEEAKPQPAKTITIK